ncbi:conserved hypothetical protein [Trichinella spiralis]|uniref:hypothetical protein n=1 Tax=Trichinella spiralis TaxID=6334 RepID=UPI0001EFC9DA|nr:conserved hypothetical protein [Trichinella spiralis]
MRSPLRCCSTVPDFPTSRTVTTTRTCIDDGGCSPIIILPVFHITAILENCRCPKLIEQRRREFSCSKLFSSATINLRYYSHSRLVDQQRCVVGVVVFSTTTTTTTTTIFIFLFMLFRRRKKAAKIAALAAPVVNIRTTITTRPRPQQLLLRWPQRRLSRSCWARRRCFNITICKI